MKRLIFVIALATSANAYAQFNPFDFFNAILGIIESEVNGGTGPILEDSGDLIALGQVVLNRNKDQDTLSLPRCRTNGNERVSQLRFVVRKNKVFIERIRVQYQNNNVQTFIVNRTYRDRASSGWINLRGGNDRCIRKIRVTGQVGETNGNLASTRSVISFVGRKE